MSEAGCNLVGEGITDSAGNAVGACVCGPSVSWCSGETKPYTYRTRHECKLNLAMKIAYGKYLLLFLLILNNKSIFILKIYPSFFL